MAQRPATDPPPYPDGPSTVLLIAAFVFGGALAGLGIAYGIAGGSPGAVFVGFMALPLVFGAALGAWRTVLMAKLATGMTRALVRSRGDWEGFKQEFGRSIGVRTDPSQPVVMPGTWVILPTSAAVGTIAALLMAAFASTNAVLSGVLLLIGALVVGSVMRRLARAGRLPIPD